MFSPAPNGDGHRLMTSIASCDLGSLDISS
jgi:hypothetical protein